MLTWRDVLLNYPDILTGYALLIIYLFAVMDEHAVRRKLRHLPSLLAATVFTTVFALIYDRLSIPGSYIVGSAVNLLICTVWAMRVWRISFWRAISAVCMAGILQVATAGLPNITDLPLPSDIADSSAVLYVMYVIAVLFSAAAAFLLYKLRFGEAFLLLAEDEGSQVRTAFIMLALLVTMEAFFRLQRGILPEYHTAYVGLLIALITLIVAFVVYLARQFDAGRQLKVWQDVVARQRVYEQDLEEIRKEVRSFRHDYKNLLAGLSEQADAGEIEGIRATLMELDAGFDRRLGEKIMLSTQIGNLRILPVRSFLLSRVAAMREKGVACRLEVLYPLETIKMDVWDFIRCLGILTDNAAEAAGQTIRPWVEIVLLAEKERVYLRVSNSWDGKADPARFFEEGWSDKGEGRGLGLPGYQRILRDYPHAVSSAEWEEGVFVQELTIAGKEGKPA